MDIYHQPAGFSEGFLVFVYGLSLSDENQIILAPNGTGKTTLFHSLLTKLGANAVPFTYTENSEDLSFSNGSSSISFTTQTKDLIDLQSQIDAMNQILFPTKILKDFFPDSTEKALKTANKDYIVFTKNIASLSDDNKKQYLSYEPLTDQQRKALQPLFEKPSDLGFVLEKEEMILTLAANKQSIADQILSEENYSIFQRYDPKKHEEEIRKVGCPFCGTKDVEDPEAQFRRIVEKKAEADREEKAFFSNLSCISKIDNALEAQTQINLFVEALKSLTQKQKVTLLFTKGDFSKEEERRKCLTNYQDKMSRLSKLRDEQERLYSELSQEIDKLQSGMQFLYPGCILSTNDQTKTITISLGRKIETFSDGEKHRLYELIKVLNFSYGPNKYLLVDDPLTQLDIANQYAMVFDFIKRCAKQKEKKIVIFTCNPRLITLAYSQDPSAFRYFYLESRKTKDSVNLFIKPMDLSPSGYDSILSLSSLRKSQDPLKPYIDIVRRRNAVANVVGTAEEEENYVQPDFMKCLFVFDHLLHYDGTFSFNGLSNDFLVDAIDSFKSIQDDLSFSDSAVEKIGLLIGTRVWMEKQMFLYGLYCRYRLKTELSLSGKLLREKINEIDKQNPVDFFPAWNRSELLSKKVLLNDECHPYSQTAPFEFALSVSNQTIEFEIEAIKKLLTIDQEKMELVEKLSLEKTEDKNSFVVAYIDQKDSEDFDGYSLLILLDPGVSENVVHNLDFSSDNSSGLYSLYLPVDWILLKNSLLQSYRLPTEPGTFVKLIFSDSPLFSQKPLVGYYDKTSIGNNTALHSGFVFWDGKAKDEELEQPGSEFTKLEEACYHEQKSSNH